MKSIFLSCSRAQRAAQGLVLSLALLAAGSARAQNYVQNPDFNQPLGPTNWTVQYVGASSAADFWIKDRTTFAHRDKVYGTWDGTSYFDWYYPGGPCFWGGHFRPYHDGFAHAYFDQIVSGLTPGASYVVSAWMAQYQSQYLSDAQVYLAALGGAGMTGSNGTPPSAISYVYQNNGWAKFSVTTSASTNGQIDVQLHYNKNSYSGTANIWLNLEGFYNHISVVPVVPPPLQPQILSLSLTNRTVSLKWSTFMNNTYDIEVSPNLATWSKFQTNLYALGTNLAYTTNLVAAPSTPQFFRILSYNWVP